MSSTTAIALARRSIPAKRPHKFTKKRLEAYKFAPATPRGRSAHSQRQLKTPDPILNSVDAQVFTLADTARALFIVRPPPSILPPTIAYPSTSAASSSSSLAHPLASSWTGVENAQLPSPALRRPNDALATPLVGASRRFPNAKVQLSDEEVAELRRTRLAEPKTGVRDLANRFDCHPDVVARWQYDPADATSMALRRREMVRRVMARERREDRYHDYQGDLTFNRQLTNAERAWRRSLW